MLIHYPEALSLREARRIYFDANHFGDDGGYGSKWVDFKLGKIPFPIPNSPSRVRAVRFHDLHHVVTGYATDLTGEFEISAWEVGAGCKDFAAAWVLNLSGMAGGALTAPGRVFRAFVRGRRSRTFYGETFDPLLDLTVAGARSEYVAPEESLAPTASDRALFGAAVAAGLALGLVMIPILVPLVPLGLVALNLARRGAA